MPPKDRFAMSLSFKKMKRRTMGDAVEMTPANFIVVVTVMPKAPALPEDKR